MEAVDVGVAGLVVLRCRVEVFLVAGFDLADLVVALVLAVDFLRTVLVAVDFVAVLLVAADFFFTAAAFGVLPVVGLVERALSGFLAVGIGTYLASDSITFMSADKSVMAFT